jgi:uncharacterized protein (DUF342 family)
MSFTTFLLRLVGRHPEQVEEQKRFKENLEELDEREQELDDLLKDIREVDQAVQDKTAALSTVSSMAPGPHEPRKEQDDEAGDDTQGDAGDAR